MGVSWYLIVILIRISLLISDGEYILVGSEYLKSILESSQSFSPAAVSLIPSLPCLNRSGERGNKVHPSLRAQPLGMSGLVSRPAQTQSRASCPRVSSPLLPPCPQPPTLAAHPLTLRFSASTLYPDPGSFRCVSVSSCAPWWCAFLGVGGRKVLGVTGPQQFQNHKLCQVICKAKQT